MTDFIFQTVADILIEKGASKRLGEITTQKLGEKRSCFIVTDKGIKAAGLLKPMQASLMHAGHKVVVFDDISQDPSEEIVLSATKLAQTNNCDTFIGFGGGSSMDVARVVSILTKGQQNLKDMYGIGNVDGERFPLLQIPTTSGTGSEVTSISVVTTGKTTKLAIISHQLYADMAILDANLTLGLPSHITAATGIDAMVHALEAYTSKHKKNPVSDGLAIKALKLLGDNIQTACDNPDNIDARSNMQIGAMMAGQAFANSPVAGVHALAYPLGGHFHVSHGLSNSLVLPHVLLHNADGARNEYEEIAQILIGTKKRKNAGFALADYFLGLAHNLGIETTLKDVGVKEADLDLLAKDAMLQSRLIVNNPKDITESDARKIYQEAF